MKKYVVWYIENCPRTIEANSEEEAVIKFVNLNPIHGDGNEIDVSTVYLYELPEAQEFQVKLSAKKIR